MTATILPFPAPRIPAPPPLCPLVGQWVHDLVRGRPMRVAGAAISQGRVIAYTLFDPALGLDVRRTPDQIDAHPAGGRA